MPIKTKIFGWQNGVLATGDIQRSKMFVFAWKLMTGNDFKQVS